MGRVLVVFLGGSRLCLAGEASGGSCYAGGRRVQGAGVLVVLRLALGCWRRRKVCCSHGGLRGCIVQRTGGRAEGCSTACPTVREVGEWREGASALWLLLLWTHVAPCSCFSRRKVKVGPGYWPLAASLMTALVSQTRSKQTACEDKCSDCRRRRSSQTTWTAKRTLMLHCD